MQKIVVLPSWYPPNGGSFFVDQAQTCVQYGYKVDVVVVEETSIKDFKWSNLFRLFHTNEKDENGLFVMRIKQWRIPKSEKINTYIWCYMVYWLYTRYHKKYGKPDMIHVQSGLWAGYPASRIKRKYEVPYVITEHRARLNERQQSASHPLKKWYGQLLTPAFEYADHIIPVSSLLIPVIQKYAPNQNKFTPIPNMVDTTFFKQTPLPVINQTFIFLCVAKFMPHKAHDILIDAFKLFIQDHPNAILKLGGRGPLEKKIMQKVQHENLGHNVIFLGNLTKYKVREELEKCHCFVLSSYAEAQPVSIIEAFAVGRPVISTELVTEDIVPPFCGYLSYIKDHKDMALKMKNMVINYKQFNAEDIRKFAIHKFDRKHIFSQVNEIFQKTIQHQNP